MVEVTLELSNRAAKDLYGQLRAALEEPPEPRPIPEPVAVPPVLKIPRGVALVSFRSIWGKPQPRGRFVATYSKRRNKDYRFRKAGGITIAGRVWPGQRVTIATPDATSGGISMAEKSISLEAGDYTESVLAHGIGNPYNADYTNRSGLIINVFFNIRIANFKDVYQASGWPTAACMLKFTQR